MLRKIFAAIFLLLAIGTAVAGIYLSLENIDAEPILLEVPEAAENRVLSMMDALCQGDYATVRDCLRGQPELGMDREAADPVGVLFHDAYEESLTCELIRECYATSSGVALDVQVTALDISSLTAALRQQSQQLLAQRVEAAEDISEVYDESGNYREDVVMEVLYNAAEQLLEGNVTTVTKDVTLECIYENGQWWIVPEDTLLEIIGCGIGK